MSNEEKLILVTSYQTALNCVKKIWAENFMLELLSLYTAKLRTFKDLVAWTRLGSTEIRPVCMYCDTLSTVRQ